MGDHASVADLGSPLAIPIIVVVVDVEGSVCCVCCVCVVCGRQEEKKREWLGFVRGNEGDVSLFGYLFWYPNG